MFALLPTTDVARDRCDLIEVNHVYDNSGKHTFDQLIFWDWSTDQDRYQVRAWRLMKSTLHRPVKDWGGRLHVATWLEGDVQREVRAPTFRETWTQYDVEMWERDVLPKEARRGLLFERGPN